MYEYKNYEENVSTKCKYCNNKLYVKIFKNKIKKLQIGLYCSKCNKWHKFINENDVSYYVGCKCKVLNTYGSLKETSLYPFQKYFIYKYK